MNKIFDMKPVVEEVKAYRDIRTEAFRKFLNNAEDQDIMVCLVPYDGMGYDITLTTVGSDHKDTMIVRCGGDALCILRDKDNVEYGITSLQLYRDGFEPKQLHTFEIPGLGSLSSAEDCLAS